MMIHFLVIVTMRAINGRGKLSVPVPAGRVGAVTRLSDDPDEPVPDTTSLG